jgi:AmmeMemoRadiSam system protein A
MPNTELGATLLRLARAAIGERLGQPAPADAGHARLQEPGATFVTLTQQGNLRGCIGSLEAHRPLAQDVRENALAAAFRDPRFSPLAVEEFEFTSIEVSLLTPALPLAFRDEADFMGQLRPGVDGIVFQYTPAAGGMSSTTAASSATSARATASCTTASAALCFVRQRAGEQHGADHLRARSGFCIDPIEKKPLNHFYPGSSVLSFGTAGCNLACKFCQNWDISKSRDMDRLMDQASPEEIARAPPGRLQKRGLHLQRPGHLRRVRHGRGRRLPRARHPDGGGDGRLHR